MKVDKSNDHYHPTILAIKHQLKSEVIISPCKYREQVGHVIHTMDV